MLSAVFINSDIFARTVTIENQSPYIFSVYTDASLTDVLDICNYRYEHISKSGEEGDSIEVDLDHDQAISFHFRQVDKSGEQIIAEAEAVADGGIKAFAFYNLINSLLEQISQDSYVYPYVKKYLPYASIASTAIMFGYGLMNRSLTLPGIIYEQVPRNLYNYKVKITENNGRIFIEKLKIKEKEE